MRTSNDYRFSLGAAATLIGFGLSKLLAQLFLGNWQVLSAGQSDIAARGVWLLAAFLPGITIGSLVLAVVLVVTLTRRTGQPLRTRLALATLGGAAGAALIFFGADPFALVLNLLAWPDSSAYYVVSAVVALVIFGAGVTMVVRVARASRVVPAAA